MVYARTLKGKTLTFMVSGTLWRNSLVMQDRETDTMWSHVTGEAILGEMEGEQLEMLPASHTTWSRWKARHPDTEVLVKDKEFKESGYEAYFSDKEKTGIFRANWLTGKMPGKARVLGVRRGVHALAVTEERLAEPGDFVMGHLGEACVAVVRARDGAVRAFVTGTGPHPLRFVRGEGENIRDLCTASLWDLPEGRALEGEMAGRQLEEIGVTTAFWFAWSSFFPYTAVID